MRKLSGLCFYWCTVKSSTSTCHFTLAYAGTHKQTNSLVEYLLRIRNILHSQYIRCYEILHWIEYRPLSQDSAPASIFLYLQINIKFLVQFLAPCLLVTNPNKSFDATEAKSA